MKSITPIVAGAVVFAVALVALSTTPVRAQAAGAGSIRGTVVDDDIDSALAGVRVTIVGTAVGVLTQDDGGFVFERIPAGTYTLSFSKEGYERKLVPGVSVSPGRLTELRIDLSAEVFEMEPLVVTGEDLLADTEGGLLEVRAEAVTLQDSISSELLGKAGVSDAAGALKLVVGASVAEGKYATVRGLSDRYTGTTLNGIRIPSPDPRRRAVQVDMFPAGTIESVNVTKTFTPDLQGDFTGGGVDIKTKSIPDGKFLRVALASEYSADATGNDAFLTYENGGVGMFGISGDSRDLPEVAKLPQPTPPRAVAKPTEEQLADAQTIDTTTRAFEPVMGVRREGPGPGYGYSILGGSRHEFPSSVNLGWLAAITSSRKYDFYEDGTNNVAGVSVAEQPMAITKAWKDSRGTEEILLGGLAGLTVRIGDRHEIATRVVANQAAEDEGRLQVQNVDGINLDQNQSLHYTERTLVSPQVQGRHDLVGVLARPGSERGFTDLRMRWSVALNYTRQFEPDVRFFANRYNTETRSAFFVGGTNDVDRTRRIFRDIKERDRQAAFDADFKFRQWTEDEGMLRVGLYGDGAKRDYGQRSYSYAFQPQLRARPGDPAYPAYLYNNGLSSFVVERDCATGGCSSDLLWTDVFLNDDRIGLAQNQPPSPNQLLWYLFPLGNDVNYAGEQQLGAAYAMVELPLISSLKLVGGARFESTKLAIDPVNPVSGLVPVIIDLGEGNRGLSYVPQEEGAVDLDVARTLPSLGLVYEPIPKMAVRASWSKTLARPTFRELAPVASEEFLAGDEFIGNPDLTLPEISNYDLRWEWFPGAEEVLSASLFYKRLVDPIEYISFGVANRSFIQPVNYPTGELKGFEVEARMGLGRLWSGFAGLAIGANYTSLHSEVEVPADELASLAAYDLDEPTRQLQGQPRYLVNVNLTYDNEKSGTSTGLFYNRTGRTLLTGAARGVEDATPNVFEDMNQVLDFTFSQKLPKGFKVGFRARNLFGWWGKDTFYLRPNGERATKFSRDYGSTYTVSLSWAW